MSVSGFGPWGLAACFQCQPGGSEVRVIEFGSFSQASQDLQRMHSGGV